MNFHKLCCSINSQLIKGNKLTMCHDILKSYSCIDIINRVRYSDNIYNKTLLYENDLFSIYIIGWKPLQESKIHNHPENGCLLKVIQGKLFENLYSNNDNKLSFINSNVINKNDIGYLAGDETLHNIVNSDTHTISVHIYSPGKYKSYYYD